MSVIKTLDLAKGLAYEKHVVNMLRHEFDKIWLWKDVPESILIQNKIILDYNTYTDCRRDIGIDVIAVKNDIYYYIQCKNYENAVCVNDIAGFLFFMITNNVNGILCYSNSVSKNIVNTIQEKEDIMNLKITLKHIPFDNVDVIVPTKIQHIPREYQIDAVRSIGQMDHKSCILAMPCGTGKTFTISIIAKRYNNIIVLSPLKKLTYDVLNNLSIFLGNKYNKILISSDGYRDSDSIIGMLGARNIIGCTYDSADVLVEIMDNLKHTMIVIDEFHNLSYNNLNNPKDNLYQVLNTNEKKVYLSATPNMNVNHDVVYKYKWEDAIKDKYICDFNITIPTEEVIDMNNLEKVMKFLKDMKTEINEKIIQKGYFLIKSLLFNGNRKCIVYLTTVEKANLFNAIITGLLKLLNVPCEIHMITNRTNKRDRENAMYKFRNNDVLTILLNVHILDEGIDVPECDSVYVTQPNDNIDNLIQRMCRCNRRTETKIECNMYIWTTATKAGRILEHIKNNTYNDIFKKVQKYSPITNCVTKETKRIKVTKIKKDINDRSDELIDIIDETKREKMTHRFICNNCGKVFKRQSNLDYHVNNKVCTGKMFDIDSGQNENIYRCKFCNKRFTTATSMYRHVNHTCRIKRKEYIKKENICDRLLKLEEKNDKIRKQNKKIIKKVNILQNHKA